MKRLTLLIVILLLAACAPTPTTVPIDSKPIGSTPAPSIVTTNPRSESDIQFKGGHGLPVDTRIYYLTGEVVGEVESLTRQVAPARSSLSVYGSYASGYSVGPTINGKSFIRLKVDAIKPTDTDWVAVGQIVIVKGTDTKLTALLPGDKVSIMCRRQAEPIAAVYPDEYYDQNTHTTWELDYCRMESPVVDYQR